MEKVNLQSINNGAAVDLFQEEFDKVLRNINDINVKSSVAREIVLTFKIQPSGDNSTATVTISAKTKLAPTQTHQSSMFLSNKNNKIEAFVTNPNQMNMFEDNKQ